MRSIRFHDEARLELVHEVGYYTAVGPQLGERFDKAVQLATKRACSRPFNASKSPTRFPEDPNFVCRVFRSARHRRAQRQFAPEHLIVLKLEAAINRRDSEHGGKDVKDIIRLLLVAAQAEKTGNPFDTNEACAFMRQAHFEMLVEVMKSPEFAGLALGNAQLAARLRTTCAGVMSKIEAVFAAS